MLINGFQKLTLLDYPGEVACMIFTAGCNFSCPYCQNSSLIDEAKEGLIKEDEIFNYLNKRKNVIDGLVISGGEPTIQSGLKEFIIRVKKMQIKIKLDTNGYNPDVLKDLLDNNLIDYVAMDIKDSLDEYTRICAKKINPKLIEKSIDILKKSNIDHEFRTTIIKNFHDMDTIQKILELVGSKNKYYLQNFVLSENVLNKKLVGFEKNELVEIKNKLKEKFPNVEVRGL